MNGAHGTDQRDLRQRVWRRRGVHEDLHQSDHYIANTNYIFLNGGDSGSLLTEDVVMKPPQWLSRGNH